MIKEEVVIACFCLFVCLFVCLFIFTLVFLQAAANVFQNHVEKSVQSSDETKALSALRSRCGIGATVVSARINDISTDTYWNESLVCVPFYSNSTPNVCFFF